MRAILSLFLGILMLSGYPLSSVAQNRIYGYELMTPQERLEHRNKMRSFETQREREAYRLEHHKQMQERARVKGLTLPDMPRGTGAGMGRRGGMGSGGGRGMGGRGRRN